MIVFGLTGGICCGKSTVSKVFSSHEINIVDADIVARQVVEPGKLGLSLLTKRFGADILHTDGTLNRALLGELVFSHPNLVEREHNLQDLNSILLPIIHAESKRQFSQLKLQGCKLAGWDAATIVEHGSADLYRPLVVVHCTSEQQIERMLRRGLTREQACDRMSAQLSTAEKLKLADYCIDTSGTIEQSIEQTKVVIQQLRKLIK